MNKCGWVRNGGECILQQENQELKSELETYNKGCSELRKIIEHKDEKINELKKQLEEKILESSYFDMITDENIELKKQLENKYSKIGTFTNEVLYEENTKLINQQKEFIEYLEKEMKEYDSLVKQGFIFERYRCLKEILSKYKEIIGGKE